MTDARLSTEAAKVLVQPSPAGQLSTLATKALVRPAPAGRMSTVAVKVLVQRSRSTNAAFYDGTPADRPAEMLGWWNGTAYQPVECLGWWDGDSIEPVG